MPAGSKVPGGVTGPDGISSGPNPSEPNLRFQLRSNGARPWCAVAIEPGRVALARVDVTPGARPKLALFDERPVAGAVVDTLAALRRDHRLDRVRCVALLNAGEYQCSVVEAPAVPEAELESAVRWRLKDLIDYPPEEAGVDVLPLPNGGVAGRPATLMAVSARRARLADCLRDFDAAKAGLAAIDIQETAQRNISALLEEGERAVAVLAFTDTGGVLTVTAGGELHFARTIDLGLGQFTGPDRTVHFDRVILEVQRSLDHFDRQFGGLPLSRLVLAPFRDVESLRTMLAENLYVPVAVADLGAVLDLSAFPALADPATQGRHLRLLGAALRTG